MAIKIILAGLLVISSVIVLLTMRTTKSQPFVIETVGLDALDMHLESPYGQNSPYHALIVNRSSHNIIACEVLFELITDDGRVLPGRRIVAYQDLLEATPSARKSLLSSHPGIAPHSRMLVGLGVEPELMRVDDKLPALGQTSTEMVSKGSVGIKKLVITLNAVVIESGEALGPKGQEFLVYLKDEVLKEETP